MAHQNHIEEKFKETNPRCTLLEGHLYYREEDVINFLTTYGDQRAEEERAKVFEEMKEFTFEACPYEGTMMRVFIKNYECITPPNTTEHE
jgi:hypothetical protein